jgi:hypothetical protein
LCAFLISAIGASRYFKDLFFKDMPKLIWGVLPTRNREVTVQIKLTENICLTASLVGAPCNLTDSRMLAVVAPLTVNS